MIAILAIFFAIELEVAGLERMVTWVVVSFVGFHVVTHTVLTVRDKLLLHSSYNERYNCQINMCWSDHTTRESSSPVSQVNRNAIFPFIKIVSADLPHVWRQPPPIC